MVQLVPMTEKEYEAFMIISMKDQSQGQVKAGTWRAEEAQENMEKLCSQFLPNGLATANQYFFTIEETGTSARVGEIWYTLMEEDGKRHIYIMDIQIHDQYKRQGYGSQTFHVLEEKAREMGITTISMHVFEHNHSARAMYEKLGYIGTGTMMVKEIDL